MAILYVKAKPGSRQPQPPEWQIQPDGKCALVVAVSAPAVDGKANEAIKKRLADFFEVAKSSIDILSGETGRLKRIEMSTLDENDIISKVGQKPA